MKKADFDILVDNSVKASLPNPLSHIIDIDELNANAEFYIGNNDRILAENYPFMDKDIIAQNTSLKTGVEMRKLESVMLAEYCLSSHWLYREKINDQYAIARRAILDSYKKFHEIIGTWSIGLYTKKGVEITNDTSKGNVELF